MRMLNIAVLLGAAALSQVGFAAPASVTAYADSTPMPGVSAVANTSHQLSSNELAEVRGAYTLSDGRVLRVSSEQRKLYATTNDRKFEIVPVAKNVFVSRDGAMKLEFDQTAFSTGFAITELGSDSASKIAQN